MKSAQVSVFDQKRKQKASLNYTPPRPLSERAGEKVRERESTTAILYHCRSQRAHIVRGSGYHDMSYATENDRMMLDTA